MNAQDFEEQLRSQPLRTLPPEWRGEILGAASRECTAATLQAHNRSEGRWLTWLHEILWPTPVAWGALGCLWLIGLVPAITAANHPLAKAPSRPSAVQQQLIREQREFMAREIGPATLPTAWRTDRARPTAAGEAPPEADANIRLHRWSMSSSEGELA